MTKLQYNNKQYTITISSGYVKQAGLEKGSEVIISFNERGNLEISKVKK